jgi:hypothetical protein
MTQVAQRLLNLDFVFYHGQNQHFIETGKGSFFLPFMPYVTSFILIIELFLLKLKMIEFDMQFTLYFMPTYFSQSAVVYSLVSS